MKWKISLSKSADKFIKNDHITEDDVVDLVRRAVKKLRGEDINIDIARLSGQWEGYFRIRKGKLRIIAGFDFENLTVFIEEIDWRGNIY